VDGAINAASARQRRVRRVHDRVNWDLGDIAYHQLQFASAGVHYEHC
jgi:hypothetical protein